MRAISQRILKYGPQYEYPCARFAHNFMSHYINCHQIAKLWPLEAIEGHCASNISRHILCTTALLFRFDDSVAELPRSTFFAISLRRPTGGNATLTEDVVFAKRAYYKCARTCDRRFTVTCQPIVALVLLVSPSFTLVGEKVWRQTSCLYDRRGSRSLHINGYNT